MRKPSIASYQLTLKSGFPTLRHTHSQPPTKVVSRSWAEKSGPLLSARFTMLPRILFYFFFFCHRKGKSQADHATSGIIPFSPFSTLTFWGWKWEFGKRASFPRALTTPGHQDWVSGGKVTTARRRERLIAFDMRFSEFSHDFRVRFFRKVTSSGQLSAARVQMPGSKAAASDSMRMHLDKYVKLICYMILINLFIAYV